MNKNKTREIVLMSFYIALFIVFEVAGNMIVFFKMPQGGSLGISTIPLLLASYHLGWRKGLYIGLLSVLLQFMTGVIYSPNLLGFLLDYVLAFSIYGLASIFPNRKWFYSGVIITNLSRLLFSTISGVIVWKTTWIASFVYNAYFMIPTMLLGIIMIPLLIDVLHIKKE